MSFSISALPLEFTIFHKVVASFLHMKKPRSKLQYYIPLMATDPVMSQITESFGVEGT